MKSFRSHLDERILCQQIRMTRSQHKGSFLLLEGSTDIQRFSRFLASSCMPINCWGKSNVTKTIEILYEDAFPGAVGVIDADFDRIQNSVTIHEGLCISAFHDHDLDLVHTGALEHYINEVADKSKLQKIGGVSALTEMLMKNLHPLSVLRYVNQKRKLGYKLNRLDHSVFFNGIICDIEKLVENASQGSLNSEQNKVSLISLIKQFLHLPLDLAQLTSGHDFCAALGISLRSEIGERRVSQTWRTEIEMHLRLTFDLSHFSQTSTFCFLRAWEANCPPYKILA